MGECLIMSVKELKRKSILEGVVGGRLSLQDAGSRLGVSYRQAKRIKRRFVNEGDVGLVNRSRGRASSHKYPLVFKDQVLALYRSEYMGYGPTFVSEYLEENRGIKINAETLRLWLLEANLWVRQRKRKRYRQRRERRECFGELLQIDGSDHPWFGEDKPRSCLLNMVDDATGRTMSQLDSGETCKVLLSTFRMWVERYGVPKAVYVDLKNIYVSPKGFNAFERVCYLLNVKIIKAYSPQAKGRVERNHGVYQDRFVKELKLKNITTIEEANAFLIASYLDKINKKFAKEPKSKVDAHCPVKAYGDLDQIFCWEYERRINNDFTIAFNNEFYQLAKEQAVKLRPKQKITVHIGLDSVVSLWQAESKLSYKKIAPPVKIVLPKKEFDSFQCSKNSRTNRHRSPWSQFNPLWLKGKRVYANS